MNDVSPVEHEMSVIVSSKNLIDYSIFTTCSANGVTISYSKDEDCFILNGTMTVTTPIDLGRLNIYAKNKIIAISTKYVSGTVTIPTGGYAVLYLGKGNSPAGTVHNYRSTMNFAEKDTTGTPSALTDYDYINKAWFYITQGVVLENYKVKIQVEFGNQSTEYTPHISDFSSVTISKKAENETVLATYTPSADGKVSGVKNIYPTTTLLSDTDGIIIEVEYNRDINKAFEQLQNAVLSQGGNV